MEEVLEFVERLPKAELHLHIEGSLEPELLFKIAERNCVKLPYTLEEAKANRLNYQCLDEFIQEADIALSALQKQQDFYDIAMEYYKKAREDNVVYSEVFFHPQIFMGKGIEFEEIIQGLWSASKDALEFGMESKLILCLLRDLPTENAMQCVLEASRHKDKVSGVGLASSEVGNPARNFKLVFEKAAELGLCGPEGKWKVAHAGEEGDASYVIDTLVSLQVARIDHGVRALEDPFLVEYLVETKIPLTVCPNSNLKLEVLKRFFNSNHVVQKMMEMGLNISLHSDDPAFFGGYVNSNFKVAVESFENLTHDQMKQMCFQLCKNSFEAAFLEKEQLSKYLSLLENSVTKLTI
mmetsp:Transcript_286/g.508  ORF Transcript_286/g.508 Transcript_286/m.508 type:complete len:352 (-) Transcript_286:18-1073(-)